MSGGCGIRPNRSRASCARPPGWATGSARPWPRYGAQALRHWVERTGEAWPGDADVFVNSNNDQHAAALYDAAAFASLVHRTGRQITATPAPGG
jgi:uncharacterized protein YecE (DUF72 family)